MTDYKQQRRILVAHDLHMLADILRDCGRDSVSVDEILAIGDAIKRGEPIYASIYKVVVQDSEEPEST